MSKVEKTENALTTQQNFATLLPTTAESMDEGIIERPSGSYLPFMEMVFPIMATPEKPFYEGNNYKFGFVNGTEFEAFPAGTIFTVMDKRNAAKFVENLPDGTKKNHYAYSKLSRNGKDFGQSDDRFQEMLAESKTDKSYLIGHSFVVAAIFPDERVVVLDFSSFKTVDGYMFGPLSPAMLLKKAGLKINIEDHKVNLTKSKASGHYYPDGKKFKQWEHVTLTQVQIRNVMSAFETVQEAYANWVNK